MALANLRVFSRALWHRMRVSGSAAQFRRRCPYAVVAPRCAGCSGSVRPRSLLACSRFRLPLHCWVLVQPTLTKLLIDDGLLARQFDTILLLVAAIFLWWGWWRHCCPARIAISTPTSRIRTV